MNKQFFLFAVLGLQFTLCGNHPSPHVVSGEVHVEHLDGKSRRIVASDKAILNWKEFSIGAGEKTEFVQPSSRAAVLNRVTGDKISLIDGRLEANGRIYLVNPNGIVIGKQGVISASSFVGTTHTVNDQEFLSQGEILLRGESSAKILNLGRLCATDGDVVLIAHGVENSGVIAAPMGEVLIGAGREVILKPSDDDRIQIRLSNENGEGTGIDLNGTIEAVRAHVKADGNLYGLAINQQGIIQATGIVEKEGRVLLVAEKGRIQADGKMIAKGGDIRLIGADVGVGKEAILDASGHEFGNGGNVVVWGDQHALFDGVINIDGGSRAGNGGFAEVSSGELLDYRGVTTALAPHGKIGLLLLDPPDLTISTGADNNVTGTPPASCYTPTAVASNLNTTTLTTSLGTSNVCVATGGGVGAGSGNITVANDVIWNANTRLTLDTSATSSGSITINSGVTVQSTGITSQMVFSSAGDINVSGTANILEAGNLFQMTAGGAINISNTGGTNSISGTGTFSGSGGVNLSHTIVGSGAYSMTSAGTITFSSGAQLQLSGGDISLNGGSININTSQPLIGGAISLTSSGDTNLSGNITASGALSFSSGGSLTLGQSTGTTINCTDATAIAGNSITLGANVALTASGVATFVVDNANPTSPDIGTAGFFVAAGATVNTRTPAAGSGSLFVYTARQNQNTIGAGLPFNGSNFTNEPVGVNSNTARWATYYPSSFQPTEAVPYTFFYKEPLPTPGVINDVIIIITQNTGSQSQSTAVTAGYPTQVATFQPLNQPPGDIGTSDYSSNLHVGTLTRPSMSTTVCSQ
jgi:filamentous hemagglutinin family protein